MPDVQEPIKGIVHDWTGGVRLQLDRKMEDGGTLEEVLTKHIQATMDVELRNQKGIIANLRKWQKYYKGVRDEKGYPYEGAANVAIPITRSDADAIFVRIYDALTNKRKFFLMKPKGVADPQKEAYFKALETAFEHYLRNVLNFRERIRPAVLQGVKTGTGILRLVYETKNECHYTYATPQQLADPTIEKYKPAKGDLMVKNTSLVFRGPNVYPVPREDFIISSDATNIKNAYMVGMAFTLRKPELKLRGKRDIYIKANVDKCTPVMVQDDIKQDRAEAHGGHIEKTQYEEPYRLWELWLKYDVDDDGEEDDIVVTWNHENGVILNAIYNPLFYGYRPFSDLRGNQIEFTYDGEGVCEILEAIQEEIDAIHNLRLDRLAQINLPVTLVRQGLGLKDFKLTPGKTWVIDENLEEAVRVINFPDVYFSLDREEDRLVAYGDRSVGITQNVLGNSTAERPVAKETLINVEEANKKFKSWTESFRAGLLELGYMLLEMFAQYQPSYTYQDETGKQVSIPMPMGSIRDTLDLDLEVSSEQMNMEVRREMNIAKYQILSDYMTKMAGMVQVFVDPAQNSEMKKFILEVNNIGSKILNAVMEDFDERSPEAIVPDMNKVLDVQKDIMMSADIQAMLQQQQGINPVQPGQGAQAPNPNQQGPAPQPAPQGGMNGPAQAVPPQG